MDFHASSGAEVNVDPFPAKLKLMRWIGRQTWVPAGADRLLRTLRSPDEGSAYPYEVDFFGLRYRGDLSRYIDWMVFFYGSYAYPELSLLEEMASILRRERSSITYVDVGANLGHHVLFMAPRADRIVAFEPNPESLSLIREKIALNRLSHIDLIPVGLGSEDSEINYHMRADGNSGAGTLCPEDKPGLYAKTLVVPVCNGDRLFAERNLPQIDLMKVDVEGFESHVFGGLKSRIQQDRPVILTELSGRTKTAFGGERALRDAFYPSAVFAEVVGRSGCRYRLRPFRFDTSEEVLIVPPEMAKLVESQIDL